MKKVTLIFIAVLFYNMTHSQVGIGNTDPKATLHISGKPTDNTAVDGVILPKLTGNELKAKDLIYTADQLGAMVYVTAAASPTTAKTANVTAAGYYYYDGSVWLKSNSNLQVGYKTIVAAYPTTPSKGDIVFTTSDGTVAGTKYRIETYDGTNWVNDKGVYSYIVTLAYATGDIVKKDGLLYESNAAIPANTAFAIGTTGATWKTLTGTAEYGSVYPTNNSSISSATIADLAGATLNLPSAGVYRVYYNISTTGNQDGGHCIIAITDSSNVVYNGSSSSSTKIYGGSIASMATQELTITVNAPTSIKLRWNTNGAGTSTLVNNTNYSSVFGYEKIAGFLPVANYPTVPNWTDGGAFTIGATTTAPSMPSAVTRNNVYYKQIGPKTWQVEMILDYTSITGATSGTGDYLFTLPNGLTFDQTIYTQEYYTGTVQTNSWINAGKRLPNSRATIYRVSDGIGVSDSGIVPWDASRFRISLSLYGSAIQCMSSNFFQFNQGGFNLRINFTFQSTN